jgi:hypothetical protein
MPLAFDLLEFDLKIGSRHSRQIAEPVLPSFAAICQKWSGNREPGPSDVSLLKFAEIVCQTTRAPTGPRDIEGKGGKIRIWSAIPNVPGGQKK